MSGLPLGKHLGASSAFPPTTSGCELNFYQVVKDFDMPFQVDLVLSLFSAGESSR